ncbi:MAG: hypothetical protein IJD06_11505 [Clostridia bacterium]|nr:hypothetical protein [Clostridia bacterium]
METMLLIFYVIVLLVQILWLVRCILHPMPCLWGILLGVQALSAAGAFFLMRYYDSLPGSGKAPGLTYLGETLFSMGACIAYAVMLGITLAAGAVVLLHRNGKR